MALKAVYERFLQSPNSQSLSESITLTYVTTLTAYKEQDRILQHLEHQNRNVVKKKAEKVISAVEGPASIALDVETTLEFLSSGGAYLPGLDSFILDKVATLPITHIVHFDRDDKITQIRMSWDQGDLLKQVEVIGTRGKNWPIFAGKEQIKLISNSNQSAAAINPANEPRGRAVEAGEIGSRSSSPTKRYIKDPHASLDLFQAQRAEEEEYRKSNPNAVAPRQSARPAPREMSELFAAGHEDLQPSPGGSPKKYSREQVVAPKGAGHKKFQPSRLFEHEEEEPEKEKKIYKTNPARYNHFDLGDPDDDDPMQHRAPPAQATQHIPMRARTDRHQSQWDFEDFVTPAKVRQKIRDQDVVHFSYDDAGQGAGPEQAKPVKSRKDAETHFEFQDDGTPLNRPAAAPKPRKDAETHFDFRDEATPGPRRIIARTKAAAGLYQDPVFEEEDNSQPLSSITNKNRRNDFSSHWDMGSESPAPNKENRPTGNQRKGLETHWGVEAEEPAAKTSTRNGRKSTEKHWDF